MDPVKGCKKGDERGLRHNPAKKGVGRPKPGGSFPRQPTKLHVFLELTNEARPIHCVSYTVSLEPKRLNPLPKCNVKLCFN